MRAKGHLLTVLKGSVCGFQDQPMLRIHSRRLLGGDGEERCIKDPRILSQEMGTATVELVGLSEESET